MAVDVKNLFNEQLKTAIERNPEAAKKIGGIYQLAITGAGTWTIDLASDPPSCKEGPSANPNCSIEVAEPDFQSLYSDANQGMKLYMSGKLKVRGNPMLAMNLKKLFDLK
jgi:putative sterol carrier protein